MSLFKRESRNKNSEMDDSIDIRKSGKKRKTKILLSIFLLAIAGFIFIYKIDFSSGWLRSGKFQLSAKGNDINKPKSMFQEEKLNINNSPDDSKERQMIQKQGKAKDAKEERQNLIDKLKALQSELSIKTRQMRVMEMETKKAELTAKKDEFEARSKLVKKNPYLIMGQGHASSPDIEKTFAKMLTPHPDTNPPKSFTPEGPVYIPRENEKKNAFREESRLISETKLPDIQLRMITLLPDKEVLIELEHKQFVLREGDGFGDFILEKINENGIRIMKENKSYFLPLSRMAPKSTDRPPDIPPFAYSIGTPPVVRDGVNTDNKRLKDRR